MVQKNSWKTRGFPNLVGSIGEKAAKKWLESKGYKIYSFREITRELKNVYPQKYEMLKKLSIARRQLGKSEKEKRLEKGLGRKRGVGFDYIARKNDNIFFIEVKTNKGKLEKYQRRYSKIVKEYGFSAMVLRLTVEITVGNSIKFVEPEMVYDEKNLERNSLDSELLPSQRFDFNAEYNSIASKVAKVWLLENGYAVYDFFWDFLGKVTDLRFSLQALQEEFLTLPFDNRLKDLIEYEKAIKKLSEDADVELDSRYYTYFGIGSDFVVKKNHEVYFVDVVVNQAEQKKFSKTSYQIAKKHGLKTMVLNLDVEIKVGEINLTEI